MRYTRFLTVKEQSMASHKYQLEFPFFGGAANLNGTRLLLFFFFNFHALFIADFFFSLYTELVLLVYFTLSPTITGINRRW